ncbi:MAG TPA: hypothetical protein VHR47_02705, partial [Bacillota bacterium]|nr:hypothetical protein [Bacillota bacterium]
MKRHVVFLALFVSLLALFVLDPIDRVKACGPYPPTDLEPTFSGGDYLSFVEFDLANDSLFKNYYYYEVSRSQEPGYPAYNEERETMNTYRDNLEEWRKLLGPEINLETTYKLVYKSSLSELNQLYGILIGNDMKKRTLKLAPFLKDPRFQTMIAKRQIDLLKYLIFAKTCEPQVTADDPWADPPKSRDYKLMDKLIQKGLKAYHDCPADDLKVRYAYQIIRLAHYAGFYDDCVKLYDQLVPSLQTKSIF